MPASKELQKANMAHVSVFMFLRLNSQSIRAFATENNVQGMGPQPFKELVYFNNAASQDVLKANAAVIAHLLVVFVATYYTQQREKSYEGKSVPDVVSELTALMVQPDKAVFDLATKIDAIYRFKSEASAAVPVAEIADSVSISAGTGKKLKKLDIK